MNVARNLEGQRCEEEIRRYNGDYTELIVTDKVRLMTLELQAPLHMHIPFEQSREVVLIDAFLSDHAEVGGQQRQSDGQQVWLTEQTVAEHPTGYQAHQVDL